MENKGNELMVLKVKETSNGRRCYARIQLVTLVIYNCEFNIGDTLRLTNQ